MVYLPNLEDKTDEELAQLTLKNQEIFACLVNRYSDKLFRYIMRISDLSREDGEDLLQDIFIKAYKNLNSFDKKLKFSSWIYRIAHNQVIDNFRRKKIRPRHISWEDNENLMVELLAEEGASHRIDREIDHERLIKALDNMDYKYKEILELRFLEDKNYQEISDILKKPAGTVASLLNRAKSKLAEEITKQQ